MLQKCPICCENALRRWKNTLLLQECPKHVQKCPNFTMHIPDISVIITVIIIIIIIFITNQ